MHRCYFIPITDLTSRADVPGWVASLDRNGETEEDTRKAVAAILGDVRRDGLTAVLTWTERLDGVPLDSTALRVPESTLEAARADLDQRQPDLMSALRKMIASVRRFA